MDGRGFIKIPRSLLNEWQDILTPEEQGILVNLMAMANYEARPKRAPKGDYLQRGQLVISIRTFAKRFQVSESRAYRMLKRWESIGLIRRETKSGADAETRSGTLLTLEFYAFSQNARNSKRSGNRNENDQTIRRNRNTDKPSPSPALNGPGGEAGTGTGDLPDADHDQQPPGIIFLQT